MHTTIYRIGKQQELTISTGNSIQYLIIMEKKLKNKKYIYIITESVSGTCKTKTML